MWGIGARFPEASADVSGALQPQYEALRDALDGVRGKCLEQHKKGSVYSLALRQVSLAKALGGVHRMVEASWASLGTQYEEARLLDSAVAKFADLASAKNFDVATALSWTLVDGMSGALGSEKACAEFSPAAAALGAIAWATNPERIYQSAFRVLGADPGAKWLRGPKDVEVPGSVSGWLARGILATVGTPDKRLEGCEIAEGSFVVEVMGGEAASGSTLNGAGSGASTVATVAGPGADSTKTDPQGKAPSGPAAKKPSREKTKPATVRLDKPAAAAPRAYFSVSKNLLGVDEGEGAPGSRNGVLNPGELVSLLLSVKPALAGTWLVSESIVPERIPDCMVVPWKELEAPEGASEIRIPLPALLVSTRCRSNESLVLKLLSSQSSQTQSITVALNAKSVGASGKIGRMLIDADMPGFSAVASVEGGVGPDMSLELTPTFELSGATSATISGPFQESGFFNTLKPLEEGTPLVPYRDGLVRSVDDIDVTTVAKDRFKPASRSRCVSPLTCDPAILWLGFDVVTDSDGVPYSIRRYTTLPLASQN